jgi:anti-sigma regulatory factor (Ser/Thr protein kinase)
MTGEQGTRLVRVRVPALSDRLKLIRSVVRDAALISGCSEACAEDIVIAVNEACMNVLEHGYRNRPGGELIVDLAAEDGELVVEIVDYAPPVDPTQVRPRPIQELRPGGLGTHFMRECMDRVSYLTPPQGAGNLLRMAKRIA